MRRFVIAARLDGKFDALAKLETLVEERHPDGVLFAGGIVENSALPGAEKLKTWERVLNRLGKLPVFTAVIPGAGEAPLQEFLRLATAAELVHPTLHIAHATLFEQGDVALCGLGGELTEVNDRTDERLCYARASAEFFLRSLGWAPQPHKVLLLSVAPPGPLGDEASNQICGDMIDNYHPSLCVVAGSTSRRGVQTIARTLVVNPGRLADNSMAWLDWTRDRGKQVEFPELQHA